MRVGVYVDGFNLYYGARGLCGRGTAGWRWLD
ncbi:MAG TPA: NYN domain-containing protein, partial [Candidatus Dormibacteraeota bacterium]